MNNVSLIERLLPYITMMLLIFLMAGVQVLKYYNHDKINNIINESTKAKTEDVSLFWVDKELYMVDGGNNVYRLERIR